MYESVSIVIDCAVSGLLFALPALGMMIALRFAAFPDLTIEGSFALGAATAMTCARTGHYMLGMVLGVAAGAVLGSLTGALYSVARSGKLIAGIIGMVLGQSLALILMGSTANVDRNRTMFALADTLDTALTKALETQGQPIQFFRMMFLGVLVTLAIVILLRVLRTRPGLAVRSLGKHPELLARVGYSSKWLFVVALAGANALAAGGGVMVAHHQHGFDASLSFGTVVVALIALLFGEEIYRRTVRSPEPVVPPRAHCTCVVLGAIAYSALVYIVSEVLVTTGISTGSPNLRRLLTSLILATVLLARRSHMAATAEV